MEKELESRRYDRSITANSIIKLIQSKEERNLLKNLLNTVLTEGYKKRLMAILIRRGYLVDNNFDRFSDRLYDYRNSIVHAKESQISFTKIPDLFDEDNDYQMWNYLIKIISEQCIKRMNSK